MIFFDLFGFYVTYCDVTCEFSFSMVNYRLEDFSLEENEQQQHSYEVKKKYLVREFNTRNCNEDAWSVFMPCSV